MRCKSIIILGTLVYSPNEIDKGSEFTNNVDMSWIGQIDHFENEIVSPAPASSSKTTEKTEIPPIPEIPDFSTNDVKGKLTSRCTLTPKRILR